MLTTNSPRATNIATSAGASPQSLVANNPKNTKLSWVSNFTRIVFLSTAVNWLKFEAIAFKLQTGVCLTSYIPASIPTFCQSFFATPIFFVEEHLQPFNQEGRVWLYLGIPIAEELVFRGLLQQGLLKMAPTYILNKIAPKYAPYVDSWIAKIARISLTAFLFASTHIHPTSSCLYRKEGWDIISPFIGGLLYGALQESRGNVIYPIGMHIFNNTTIPTVLAGIIRNLGLQFWSLKKAE